MGKKSRAKSGNGPKAGRGRGEPSFWMITAIISLILLVGFIVKTVYEKTSYSSGPKLSPATVLQPVAAPAAAPAAGPLESEVLQVASNFRCACGECGELPLAECTCTTARGAVEEKAFIRGKLKEGLSAAQVIELVDKKYGHRMT
jgi:cytochrome c-type biogenesis protein CcmH/NrfF